jgi:LmbE family N-acetylglucosaminyl deacetylase
MHSLRWLLCCVACFGIGLFCASYFATTDGGGNGPSRIPSALAAANTPSPDDGKLRILAFGAHPDDCELKAGGVATLWAQQGHHVKFVALTNGDIGHWQSAGGPLANRRRQEVEAAAKRFGITTQVLDIHDGELLPTLAHRRTVTRLIRQWNADVVIAHRPNDYHPDHRYGGILVQDAAYMVTVPFFCPDVPHLTKNPVFVYYADRFLRPNPFRADVVVDIDSVIQTKLEAIVDMESQFVEGGANGHAGLLEPGREARRVTVTEYFGSRSQKTAEKHRDGLVAAYGSERGKDIQHAEAFEVCEYGRQPTATDLRALFPFFPASSATKDD